MENFLNDKVQDLIRFYTVVIVLIIGFVTLITEIHNWLIVTSPNNKIGQYAVLILISVTIISNVIWWIVEHFHRTSRK